MIRIFGGGLAENRKADWLAENEPVGKGNPVVS
jgi:hypothetical protein